MADDDPDIVIGPTRDADTGEIVEEAPNPENNDLGAENFDDDNISSYDPENDSSSDTDDFSDVDTGGSSSGGSSTSSSNGGGGSDNVASSTLTNVEGKDGFRLSQEELEEKVAAGNTENLSPAETSSQSAVEESIANINQEAGLDRKAQTEQQRTSQTVLGDIATTSDKEKEADVNLSPFQDKESDVALTEKEVRERLAAGDAQDLELTGAARTSASAIRESRRNRREQLLNQKRNKTQRITVDGRTGSPTREGKRFIQETENLRDKPRQRIKTNNYNLPDPESRDFITGSQLPLNQVNNPNAELFRREKAQTKEQEAIFLGLEQPDTEPSFGTSTDQRQFEREALRERTNLSSGELEGLRTSAQSSALEEVAATGGRQTTGTQVGGDIAAGGLSIGTDTFTALEQGTSIAQATAENSLKPENLPGRAATGFTEDVGPALINQPFREGIPEALDLLSGGTVATTVNVDASTSSALNPAENTLGEEFAISEVQTPQGRQVQNVQRSGPTQETGESTDVSEFVPDEETLPDLGERSTGRSRENILQEPESQLRGGNLLESDRAAQPETGREAGVPSDRQGLTQEEVEVLETRRQRQPGVERVESEVNEFAGIEESQPTATEVEFTTEDVLTQRFQDTQSDGSGLQGVLGGRRKGQTQGIPLIPDSDTSTDVTDGFDQTDSGRVRSEKIDSNINIIENRGDPDTGSSPSSSTDLGFGRDAATGVGLGLGQNEGLDDSTVPGLEQGQPQDQNTGQEEDTPQQFRTPTVSQPLDSGFDPFSPNENTPVFDTPIDRTPDAPNVTVDGGEQQSNNQEEGILSELFGRSQERDVQRSVGADLLGIENEDLSVSQATNPLSLRGLDQN